ncbi:uncharacterized protein LOC129573205 [Sitodiplosis mosellana]|uniref:uncharacterized protein LOC129573205 n=1 Tax=Sitodiplosis mosellana TaxID=263140 RepID=UPI002443A413|nr:uncharacterized protein LOC129573205 [Sitodiplosis mosellana]
MATAAKASATRERHASTLKKTTDTIATLTSSACQSTLAVYSSQLDTNWSSYVDAFDEHEKAIAGKDATELKTITDEYATLHAAFVKARIALGKLMSPVAGANSSFLDITVNNDSAGHKTAKLPVCKLPTFSGDRTAWVEFKATVRTMLTDQVAEIQRLQCLKEALVGEPRELIAHVLPSDGAFNRAMMLLKKEYENARAIVNESLRRLFAIARNEPNKENIATLRSIVNTVRSVTTTLIGCDIDVTTWDSILIFYTSQLLHPATVTAWEESLSGSRTIPELTTYLDFLSTRMSILQTTDAFGKGIDSRNKPAYHRSNQPKDKSGPRMFYTLKSDYKCVICQRNHTSTRCDEMLRMSVKERREAILKHGLCFNCLQSHHFDSCPFNATCKKCNEPHHTLLHPYTTAKALVTQEATVESVEEQRYDPNDDFDALSAASSAHFYHTNEKSATILATALVPVRWNGRSILLNALIDQGATTNLISERACQMLQLPFTRSNISMTGVGNAPVGRVIGRTMSTIGSYHNEDYSKDISALIVKRVADISPLNCDERVKWSYLNNLPLANPNFTRTRRVDLLLGAGVYAEILMGQIIKGGPDEPIAQHTKLGWIVFGRAEVDNDFTTLCHALQQKRVDNEPDDNLSQLLKAFWELEEIEHETHLTPDEQAAEDLFVGSLKRASDGKFIVDLPFKVDSNSLFLGESREQAERRLRLSQRRFSKNPEAKRLYDQNLDEYLSLGHMKKVEHHEVPRYFLPHHPVVKDSSSTTKVRTVSDASAKTTNGRSLNDLLLVGPTIQPELFDLLMQWRRFKYAFCGDIEKMYRQVWINPEHALFQCILWEKPGSNQIETYKLLTVTFGMACAPFQAIRILAEVGIRARLSDPELGNAICRQFYVDDYLGTTDSVVGAVHLRVRLSEELAKYGFNLRKWKANDERILDGLPKCDKEESLTSKPRSKHLASHGSQAQTSFNSNHPRPSKLKSGPNVQCCLKSPSFTIRWVGFHLAWPRPKCSCKIFGSFQNHSIGTRLYHSTLL